jgi:hypothetical protein
MVGSCHIPWWDHIAYLMKTAQNRKFSLRYPTELVVDIDGNGLSKSLTAVLRSYKKPENTDPARFLQDLAEQTKSKEPPAALRRFLSWDEAKEMIGGGMAIGSHTHSHHVLSQLEPEQQRQELAQSRSILRENLGISADAIAYPVGARDSFTDLTQTLAHEVGYRAAFSFYGGTNLPGRISPYNVGRIAIGDQSWDRFQAQTAVCRFTGSYWP